MCTFNVDFFVKPFGLICMIAYGSYEYEAFRFVHLGKKSTHPHTHTHNMLLNQHDLLFVWQDHG